MRKLPQTRDNQSDTGSTHQVASPIKQSLTFKTNQSYASNEELTKTITAASFRDSIHPDIKKSLPTKNA
jgi:hypothetical protein